MQLSIDTNIPLNIGVEMPLFGFGTWQLDEGEQAYSAVAYALKIGYRLIDTAAAYGNEHSVGRAIRESGIDRGRLFVTTKVWNNDQGYEETQFAFQQSLARLGLDYLDLYLIHWPAAGRWPGAWRAMETLLKGGQCRAIGVSNFEIDHLEELRSFATVVPAVDQVPYSPFEQNRPLLAYCREHGIALEGYSPLTRGARLHDPELVTIARKYNKSPAQTLIRWALQHGIITIPKSAHRERIKENANTPVPGTYYGVTYWWLRDVLRVRNATAHPYHLTSNVSQVGTTSNNIPIYDITTGIAGATGSMPDHAMAYQGNYQNDIETGGYVSLTFDDGPYNTSVPNDSLPEAQRATTQQLLDVLEQNNAPSAFFLNGTRIKQTQDAGTTTTNNIAVSGHEVVNHTYDHSPNLNNDTHYADEIRYQIISTWLLQRYVTNGNSKVIRYFRPPGGAGLGYGDLDDQEPKIPLLDAGKSNDSDFWTTIGEAGCTTIAWHKSVGDGPAGQTAQKIIDYLEGNPKTKQYPGLSHNDIVLLHNGRKCTVDALGYELPFLSDRYSFLLLSQIQPIYDYGDYPH